MPYSSFIGHKTQLPQGEISDGGDLIVIIINPSYYTTLSMEVRKKSRHIHVKSTISHNVTCYIVYICSCGTTQEKKQPTNYCK